MAARLTTRQADLARESIKVSLLVKKLTDHVHGKVEMAATQLRAAEILLKKCLPDLQSVEHTGEMSFKDAGQLSREELVSIAATGSAGVAQADGCDGEPAPVHQVLHS